MQGASSWLAPATSQFQLEGWRDAGARWWRCATPASHAPVSGRALASRAATAARRRCSMPSHQLERVLPPARRGGARRAGARHHTICQKPFGTDLRQAEAMSALAEARRVPLVVHENFRFTPWFRECRRLIDSGHFGRLHGISFRLRPGDGQGPRAYLDRQPYFQTMPQLLVRETAVHFIDTFRYLMGEVVAVSARLRRLNPAIAGEDAGLIVFEFDDARTGLFDGNRLNDRGRQPAPHDGRDVAGRRARRAAPGRRRAAVVEAAPRRRDRACLRARQQRRLRRGSPSAAFGGGSPAPPSAARALRCRPMCWRTCAAAPAGEQCPRLSGQPARAGAVYHSHASGHRVPMAAFDPHNP